MDGRKGGGLDPLAALGRALADGGNRRAPLRQAMLDDYERLAGRLRGRRPNWRRITEEFMREGFRNLDGTDLDPENVRVTWYRVRRAKEAGRAGVGLPGSAPGVDAPVRPAVPPAVAPGDGGAGSGGSLDAVRKRMRERSGRRDGDDG